MKTKYFTPQWPIISKLVLKAFEVLTILTLNFSSWNDYISEKLGIDDNKSHHDKKKKLPISNS